MLSPTPAFSRCSHYPSAPGPHWGEYWGFCGHSLHCWCQSHPSRDVQLGEAGKDLSLANESAGWGFGFLTVRSLGGGVTSIWPCINTYLPGYAPRTNCWMADGWLDKWLDNQVSGWAGGWTYVLIGRWVAEQVDRWMSGWKSRWTNGQVNKWMDG